MNGTLLSILSLWAVYNVLLLSVGSTSPCEVFSVLLFGREEGSLILQFDSLFTTVPYWYFWDRLRGSWGFLRILFTRHLRTLWGPGWVKLLWWVHWKLSHRLKLLLDLQIPVEGGAQDSACCKVAWKALYSPEGARRTQTPTNHGERKKKPWSSLFLIFLRALEKNLTLNVHSKNRAIEWCNWLVR